MENVTVTHKLVPEYGNDFLQIMVGEMCAKTYRNFPGTDDEAIADWIASGVLLEEVCDSLPYNLPYDVDFAVWSAVGATGVRFDHVNDDIDSDEELDGDMVVRIVNANYTGR